MKPIIFTSMPDGEMIAKWNACLADCQFATHYVTPDYFTDPYRRGEPFAVLAAEADGNVAAIMTGVFDSDKVVSGLFSRPQMVFRDEVNRPSAMAALLDGVAELSSTTKLIEIHSWDKLPAYNDNNMRERASNSDTSVVMIDLSIGEDSVFADFSQTRRNEIRKALKENRVEVKELETETELAELYNIHCDWSSRKGNPVDKFKQMQRAAFDHSNRRTFIAKTKGKVIAGSFFRFATAGVVEYAGNFSIPEYQKLRPNDLIAWRAIQWACRSGFKHFSMGGSHLFLRRFGGSIITTYRYRRDQSRFRVYELRESANDFSIAAYRRLPESVRSGMRRVLAR